ncbi:MAG: nucleotide sugar dehydrogenase [Anaerolineales bacterium]
MKFESLCVLGLGYIGLPTASTFATHGMEVRGVDVNQRVVDILRDGEVHIKEPGLRTLVQAAFHSKKLTVEAQPAPADAFIIAVPTPMTEDKKADLSNVERAAESIVPHLAAGNLVVLESTCPPRTTLDMVLPILETNGLKAGADFHLVYSPERVLPGKILHELIENARVVGGVTPESAQAGRDLYRTFVRGDIQLTDATTAEMVKLMENTYRDVNIALANEFSHLADTFGVDVWRAIELANLHPRVEVLRPGPGVGGHCIGIDPWFLVEAAPEATALIHQARTINDNQPAYAVSQIARSLGGSLEGRIIAALGLSYKADVDDLRESPAIEVVEELVEAGAEVRTYEPHAAKAKVTGAEAAASIEEVLEGAEAVVLLVDHEAFRSLDPQEAAARMKGRTAFDSRGVWPREKWRQAGFELKILGVGGANG